MQTGMGQTCHEYRISSKRALGYLKQVYETGTGPVFLKPQNRTGAGG
jgi:hypothetical protein